MCKAWNRKQAGQRRDNPADWQAGQEGGKNPLEINSGHQIGHLTGKKIEGVDPFYQQSTEEAGYGGPGGHLDAGEPDSWKYGKGAAGGVRWKEGWYDPAFVSTVVDPIRGTLGLEGKGGNTGIVGEITPEFVDARSTLQDQGLEQGVMDAFDEAISGFSGGLDSHADAGLGDSPLLHESVKTGLGQTAREYGLEKKAYDFKQAEFDQQELDAEDMKDAEMVEHTLNRQNILSGRLPEYEQSKTAQARSGMAYSAPASAEYEGLREENVMELSDVKRAEADSVSGYEGKIDEIATARESEDIALEGSQERFKSGLQNVVSDTESEIKELSNLGTGLAKDWQSYGESISNDYNDRGRILGKSRYGGAYGGGGKGLWKEDASSFEEAGWLAGIADESLNFANQLTESLGSAINITAPDGDV